jgi:phosphate transport system ATP-binding protein
MTTMTLEFPQMRTDTKLQAIPEETLTMTAAQKIDVTDFDFYYGEAKVLHGITLAVPENRVTALIGPSG